MRGVEQGAGVTPEPRGSYPEGDPIPQGDP